MNSERLRQIQEPLKQQYRNIPESARLRLTATSEADADTPLVCRVAAGGVVLEVSAHPGVGGSGEAGCSGEQLLGALAACAQITMRMVAMAADIELESVRVTVHGDLDLRGALGMTPGIDAGFQNIELAADIVTVAGQRQQRVLERLVERTCVVLNTLRQPPAIQTTFTFNAPEGG